jgi:preprotein translocase subunit SecA
MRLMKGDMVDWFMRALKVPDDVPIEDKRITKLILQAQEQVEAQHFETRKNVLKYDDVMNRQRFVVYSDRRKVLEGADVSDMLRDTVTKVVTSYVEGATEGFEEDWDFDQLWQTMKTLYPVSLRIEDYEERGPSRQELVDAFAKDAQNAYDAREAEIGEERMRSLERYVLLTVLDRKWREHLYEMDYLRVGIGLRSMASRDPLVEYQREGAGMFATMMDSVMEEVVGFLFHVQVVEQPAAQAPAPVVATAADKQRKPRGRRPALKTGPFTDPAAPATTLAPEPDDAVPAALKKRSQLDSEAAAARSELNVTAKGLSAAPASTTLSRGGVSAGGARPIAKSDTTELRANRPGQAGRRNQGKKKRK